MEDHAHDSLIPTIAEEEKVSLADAGGGVFHAAFAGGFGGLVAGLLGGVPYFLAYRGEDIPWQKLASAFFTFVILTGATYAAGARGGVATLDRFVRGKRAWTPFVGAVMGASVVGPLPGAIGVAYFGSQPYVFMGTAMLALAPIAGAWITSAVVARADRGGSLITALGCSLLATLIFGAVGAGIFFTVDDEAMLAWFRRGARAADASGEVSAMGLAFVGFQAGALLGALVGAHLGTTMVLSRMLRSISRKPSP